MLSHYLFNSFGMAIIALTIVVNVLMLQLTLKQIRSSKAMQELQPKLAELQKKYGKDRQRMAQEQMRLYKESGMNPAGCLLPMLIQMPIWIALYQSIMMVLAAAPEGLLNLSRYLYSWPIVYSMLPLNSNFIGLNLAEGNLILAILVGGTMWLQQKMITPSGADSRQQAQNRMMLWMMPLMFAFLCLTFPSGLALFWVTSSVVRIVIQYYITGWGALAPAGAPRQVPRDTRYKMRIASVEAPPKSADIEADTIESSSTQEDIIEPSSTQEEGWTYEESGDKRQDRGEGYPGGLKSIRSQSRRDRDHHPKRR